MRLDQKEGRRSTDAEIQFSFQRGQGVHVGLLSCGEAKWPVCGPERLMKGTWPQFQSSHWGNEKAKGQEGFLVPEAPAFPPC